jgi:hypothetical protein
MLFRPSADQNLDAVHALLDAWNAEADRLRRAAIAAQHGEKPTSLLAVAAEEARDGLEAMLLELEGALDRAAPGSPAFPHLLHAQTAAIGLLESIGNTLDRLERFAATPMAGATRIIHEPPPAGVAFTATAAA